DTLIQNQPYQGFYKGPNGVVKRKPYLIGVNRDEGALFADLVNQGVGGIGESAYQELLETAFGASDGAAIAGFTAGGHRPYHPTDEGTLPPWFAHSPQAAAASPPLHALRTRCGTVP